MVHGPVFCTVGHLYYAQLIPHTPHRKTGHAQFSLLQLLCLVCQQLCITHLQYLVLFTSSERDSWTVTPAKNSWCSWCSCIDTGDICTFHEAHWQDRFSRNLFVSLALSILLINKRRGYLFLSGGGIIKMSQYVVMCSFRPTGVYLV